MHAVTSSKKTPGGHSRGFLCCCAGCCLIFSIQPLAYVICYYRCYDGEYKIKKCLHCSHLLPAGKSQQQNHYSTYNLIIPALLLPRAHILYFWSYCIFIPTLMTQIRALGRHIPGHFAQFFLPFGKIEPLVSIFLRGASGLPCALRLPFVPSVDLGVGP